MTKFPMMVAVLAGLLWVGCVAYADQAEDAEKAEDLYAVLWTVEDIKAAMPLEAHWRFDTSRVKVDGPEIKDTFQRISVEKVTDDAAHLKTLTGTVGSVIRCGNAPSFANSWASLAALHPEARDAEEARIKEAAESEITLTIERRFEDLQVGDVAVRCLVVKETSKDAYARVDVVENWYAKDYPGLVVRKTTLDAQGNKYERKLTAYTKP